MRASAALSAVMLLAGCGGSGDEACDSVSVSFSMQDSTGQDASAFGMDETVAFKATVTNNGDDPATLTWNANDACTPVYFEVHDDTGATVWAGPCPPGHLCLCASDTLTLDPGEEHVTSDEWDQRLPNGNPVPGGTYTGRTVDITQCAPKLDDAKDFTLLR